MRKIDYKYGVKIGRPSDNTGITVNTSQAHKNHSNSQ